MRSIRIIFGFLVMVGTSFTLMAGEVGNLIQFQPNTKAKSSEVNQNFNTIKNAVNDNNSRISNLEGTASDHSMRIQNLESTTSDHSMRIQDLESRKILSVTYPASCFTSQFWPGLSLILSGTAWTCLVNFPGDSTNTGNSIICPIALPEGVKVLRVEVKVKDNLDSGRVAVDFCHDFNHAGSVCHVIGTTTNSGTPGETTLILDFPDGGEEQILARAGYSIVASINKENSNLCVGRITIYYEYDPTYTIPDPRD